MAENQLLKHFSKLSGSSELITLLNVSCEGIPFGKDKKVESHFSLILLYFTTSYQDSAPQIVAQIEIAIIFKSSCYLFPDLGRLSLSPLKNQLLDLFLFLYILLIIRRIQCYN